MIIIDDLLIDLINRYVSYLPLVFLLFLLASLSQLANLFRFFLDLQPIDAGGVEAAVAVAVAVEAVPISKEVDVTVDDGAGLGRLTTVPLDEAPLPLAAVPSRGCNRDNGWRTAPESGKQKHD